MSDPTESVIIASFAAATGILLVAAARRKYSSPEPMAAECLERGPDISPYVSTPEVAEFPPETSTYSPSGKVPTWFFRPFDLLGIGLILATYFVLIVASLRMAGDGEVELDPEALITTIGFQFISAGIVSAVVVPRVRATEWLGLRWSKWPWAFLIAPACVVGMWLFVYSLQTTGYVEWLESFGVEGVQDTVKLLQQSSDPLTLGLMAGAAVIAAPLCEEIVFRGYLYGAAKHFAGPWAAGIFSALVFASVHGSLVALLPLFAFGCLLVYVYEKTGSIWAPIAIHFCFNGATVLAQIASRFVHLPTDSGL